jgi:hypothetical protein
MKGNIKKLAVFAMIAAIAICIVGAKASAGDRDNNHKFINGEYGFTGGGNCIATPFLNYAPTSTNPFNLVDPTKVSANSYHANGLLTFKKDGTGTIDLYSTGTPTGPSSFTLLYPWGVTYGHATYPFTYAITDDGEFTFEAVEYKFKQESLNPLTGDVLGAVCRDHYKLKGWISADHKTIVVATPAPEIDTIFGVFSDTICLSPISKMICHDSFTCTRLSD